MAEYIERRAAIEHLNVWCGGCGSAVECILAEPAADVAPVVHGRWIFEPETENTLSMTKCNVCGWWTLDPSVDGVYKYCPSCGAKMDGGAEDAF